MVVHPVGDGGGMGAIACSVVSVVGCPVTGSLVFRGSIGPAVTLRLPFPGMLMWFDCLA